METIHVSEIRSLLLKAQSSLAVALHGIETKILIGEINRPEPLAEKKPRKRRTKKEMKEIPSKSMMDLEKEYQAGRTSPILSKANSEANRVGNLPDGDAGSTFYTKPKKREKKTDGGE